MSGRRFFVIGSLLPELTNILLSFIILDIYVGAI